MSTPSDAPNQNTITITSGGNVTVAVSSLQDENVVYSAPLARAVFTLPATIEATGPFVIASTMGRGPDGLRVTFS